MKGDQTKCENWRELIDIQCGWNRNINMKNKFTLLRFHFGRGKGKKISKCFFLLFYLETLKRHLIRCTIFIHMKKILCGIYERKQTRERK